MPGWAQDIRPDLPADAFPAAVVRAVMLKGANLHDIGFELAMLALFIPIYAILALTRFRRTLD